MKQKQLICVLLVSLFCSFSLFACTGNKTNMEFVAENEEWVCTVTIEQDSENRYLVRENMVYIGEKEYKNVNLDLNILNEHSDNITTRGASNWSSGEKCSATCTAIYPEHTDLAFITPTEGLLTITGEEQIKLVFNKI